MTLLDILRGQAANLQKAPPLCDLTRPHLYIYLNALRVVPINKNVALGQKLSPGFSSGERYISITPHQDHQRVLNLCCLLKLLK